MSFILSSGISIDENANRLNYMEQHLWLAKFLKTLHDGQWEHSNPIKIETTSANAWTLQFSLKNTPYKDMEEFSYGELLNRHNWCQVSFEKGLFKGECSANNLERVIYLFKGKIEAHTIK